MKVWRLYLLCGHDDVTFIDPKHDATIWNNHNYCADCKKRVLIAKVAQINRPDN
jgi:hypothetical protein